MVNETVKGNKRLCVKYGMDVYGCTCYFPFLSKMCFLHSKKFIELTSLLLKLDYNIVIDIKFQLTLFRKNILIHICESFLNKT